MAPVRVETYSGDVQRWNRFLADHAHASFYHRFEWVDINRRALGHDSRYLAVLRDDALHGILPLTVVNGPLFGRILCSMPFVNFGGPCTLDDSGTEMLVHAARQLAKELRAKYLELRCKFPLSTDMQLSTRKISMSLDLDPDPDAVFSRFTSKHRTNIRRSFKNGLSVSSGGAELLDEFYSVMEQSWRSLGTPLYSPDYFSTILSAFPDDVRIFVCRQGTEPIAVAFNGYFNDTVEGMWAGGTDKARGLQANYALYWEMIRDACERGFSRYHLGRSTASSNAEDFKKKWNASSQQLYWYFDRPDGGAMPELNVQNPKYRLAISTWRKLPLALTRRIGPPVARCIP